jgi:hypothetical protein
MAVLKRYRVYCETEAQYILTTGYQDTAPTTCPTDAGHTITAGSVAAVASITKRAEYAWPPLTTTGGSYTTVGVLPFQGSDVTGPLVLLEAVVGLGSANEMAARVYDVTNALVIAEALLITDVYPAFVDLGAISNVPAAPAVWELQIKRTGGGGQTNVQGACLLMGY